MRERFEETPDRHTIVTKEFITNVSEHHHVCHGSHEGDWCHYKVVFFDGIPAECSVHAHLPRPEPFMQPFDMLLVDDHAHDMGNKTYRNVSVSHWEHIREPRYGHPTEDINWYVDNATTPNLLFHVTKLFDGNEDLIRDFIHDLKPGQPE